MRKLSYVLAAAVLLAAPSLEANPVVISGYPRAEAIPGTGVVPNKNTVIRIKSEDLYISPKLVRARYEFANDTPDDINAEAAFPLPEIDTAYLTTYLIGTHTDDPVNFVGFNVLADGTPASAHVQQSAFIRTTGAQTRTVTAELNSVGLPVNPLGNTAILDRLNDDTRWRLYNAGILGTHDWDHSPGTRPRSYYPRWIVATSFVWKQVFPAHKIIGIDVSYQPITGGSLKPVRFADFTRSFSSDFFCVDTMALKKLELRQSITTMETAYILTTANYWNGPIGRFHLTLDKMRPENVLSLCWDGNLKKTGPTTFEDTRFNFAPTRDIHLIVLE